MLYISEYLPNPEGTDTTAEWIELYNEGSEAVSIEGWKLQATAKKTASLRGAIPGGGYRLLPRSDTKLLLRNTNGGVTLYDLDGRVIDTLAFRGTAPEGKSVNRTATGFFFGEPTPALPNAPRDTNMSIDITPPYDSSLARGLAPFDFLQLMLMSALILTSVTLYAAQAERTSSNNFSADD